jgi:tRNA(adenine34) deaminase
VWYGLESPNDGADELLKLWKPPVEQAFFCRPREIKGGILRSEVREQFGRYVQLESAPAGMREWARGLAQGVRG